MKEKPFFNAAIIFEFQGLSCVFACLFGVNKGWGLGLCMNSSKTEYHRNFAVYDYFEKGISFIMLNCS